MREVFEPMKMKRILSLVLMALLLCLPVWAMAATYDLSGYVPNPEWYNDIFLFGVGGTGIGDKDTITGIAPECRVIQMGTIPDGATLTLRDVYVQDGCMILGVASNGTVTLNLLGDNYLSSSRGYAGLEVHGKLIIQSRGKLGANAINPINGCDMILPDYCGPVPDGKLFTAWNVLENGINEKMKPGENLVRNGSVTIMPVFEEISAPIPPSPDPIPQPSPDLPKTGDNSNVILWSALACISVIGMMTLASKRKEA